MSDFNHYEIQNEIKATLRPLLGDYDAFRRCVSCGDHGPKNVASVKRFSSMGKLSISGSYRCENSWWCNICHFKKLCEDAKKVNYYVKGWRAKGKGILFGTFAPRHYKSNDFTHQLNLFLGVLRADAPGTTKLLVHERRAGVVAHVRAVEIGYNDRHGFSPHCHKIYLVDRPSNEIDDLLVASLQEALREQFEHACQAKGLPAPDPNIGVVLRPGLEPSSPAHGDLGGYVCKPGFVDPQKRRDGRVMSPFDFPIQSLRGNGRFRQLWREYAKATLGVDGNGLPRTRSHRRLTFSDRIYDIVGVPEWQVVNEREPGTLVGDIPREYQRDLKLDTNLRVEFLRSGIESQEEIDLFFKNYSNK